MTVINLDNDERFKVNKVTVHFEGKDYTVTADDDNIKKLATDTKLFIKNNKKFDDNMQVFDSKADKKITDNDVDQAFNHTIDFAAEQQVAVVKALNDLFGHKLGDRLYAKKHSTKALNDIYNEVIAELYELNVDDKKNKLAKFNKKAKKVK